MDTIYSITKLLSPMCFMASLDLREALPFGLSCSPRICTKVMEEALEPLKLKGISIIPYLDDLLHFPDSKSHVLSNLQVTQKPRSAPKFGEIKSVSSTRNAVLGIHHKLCAPEDFPPTGEGRENPIRGKTNPIRTSL